MTGLSAIAAVIFDLDGVLVDSEPAHRAASRELVAPAIMTDSEYAQFVGSSVEAFIGWVQSRFLPDVAMDQIVARYDSFVRAELQSRSVPAFDGAAELLAALRARGLRTAVASQSLPAWVAATLSGARLDTYFDCVVTAVDVVRPKPAADIFLYAASQLGVPPASCLVIEDSAPGVAAALAAGMTVVQSQQGATAIPAQPGVHFVVQSLRAFDFACLDVATQQRV